MQNCPKFYLQALLFLQNTEGEKLTFAEMTELKVQLNQQNKYKNSTRIEL